ncbi:MAG: DDE-type integrase/transposase/recombinase [Pseudonocardiaceae bacterium]
MAVLPVPAELPPGNGASSSGKPTPTGCVAVGPAPAQWHRDEVFLTINGQRQYLGRAVDQNGTVLDILVTSRRDTKARPGSFVSCSRAWSTCPG